MVISRVSVEWNDLLVPAVAVDVLGVGQGHWLVKVFTIDVIVCWVVVGVGTLVLVVELVGEDVLEFLLVGLVVVLVLGAGVGRIFVLNHHFVLFCYFF